MSEPSFIYPDWPAPKNVKAFVSCRAGGFSQAPYKGFNLAKHVGDDETLVEKNRQLLPHYQNITWLNQTHSTRCLNLDLPRKPSKDSLQADACFSQQSNHVCAVMTADCLPILLCDKQGSKVAAIHAGWRGLASGVIENTLATMQASAQDLFAWLGPAISQSNFEVGVEVKNAFSQYPEAFKSNDQHKGEKFLADLYSIAQSKLRALGLSNVYGGDFCTYRQQDLFFSHRRATHQLQADTQGPATTGRMVSAIYLE